MNQRQQRGRFGKYLTNLLTISDFVVVNAVYLAVLWINPDAFFGHQRLVALLVNVAYIPAAMIMRSLRARRSVHMDKLLLGTLRGITVDALVFFSLLFFLQVGTKNGWVYAELFGGWFVCLPLWGLITRLLIKARRRSGANYTRVVIVGTGPTATRLFEEMKGDPGFGYRIMGFFDYECSSHFPYRGYYVGDLDGLEQYVIDNVIDQVYYTMEGDDDHALRTSLNAADKGIAQFFVVPQLTRYLNRSMQMNTIGPIPMMMVLDNPLSSAVNRGVKRAFDLVVSSTFLLFSPLIFGPIALAIKMSSPGPVFFRQKRTGYKGRDFYCYKFRSMRVNSGADKVQATRNDPRKTRLGNFLRKTSLDELPQFINVWLGDMSVVGPRPHMLKHTEEYSKLIDKYMVRHSVRPGVTGWAQVNGYRGQTEQLWQMEKRVEYDTWYIENWTLLLDIKIMIRTVLNALRGEDKAY